jgi:predicted nucleic acid-binding protein
LIVLDASAIVELLLRSTAGEQVAHELRDPDNVVHLPHLAAVEVMQTLRRLNRLGVLSSERAGQAVADLADLAGIRHDHEPLLPRIWELRENLTAYDAAYVALAEALDAPLLTFDLKIASAPAHQAVITTLDQ